MKKTFLKILALTMLLASPLLAVSNVEASQIYDRPTNANTWAITSHNAYEAYSRGYSGQGVKVAILDSGIDTDNPLLKHAIKGGTSVVDWSDDYEDTNGHGTQVAGAIVAKSNGQPWGIAPDVDLYAVKITMHPKSDRADIKEMIKGIEWAIKNKMDIINLSFDVRAVSKEFEEVVKKANRAGIPIVNSTGNDLQNIDNEITRCQYEGVICISAIDSNDNIGIFSAYGEKEVDFGAGGVFVATAQIDSDIPTIATGTSFASPVFVGMYALHKSENPKATSEQIINHMKNTGVKLNTERPIGKYGKVYYTPMKKKVVKRDSLKK